jgi:hypothetical protein
VHYDGSFGVGPELIVHLYLENLHHHKQLTKLQGEESINNFSCNASIDYCLTHRNGEPCQWVRKCKR